MFTPEWGGQISWLIPAALIAFLVMLWVSRRGGRTDRTRAAAVMFGGWLLVAGLVLSYMSGTTHSYYSVALAPPIGALVGIGSFGLWRIRHTWFARAAMAVAIAVTAAWAWVLLGRSPGWFPWLRVTIVVAAAGAVGLILAGPVLRTATARSRMLLAAVPVSLAAIAVLGGPLAYSLDTAASSYSGASPSAGPALTAAGGGPAGAPGFGRGGFPGAGAAGRGALGDFPGGLADGRAGRGESAVRRWRRRRGGPRRHRRQRHDQRRPGQAARDRGLALHVGRGHPDLRHRGLDGTGLRRRPGHGARRLPGNRSRAQPRRVRAARLRP